MLNNQQLRGQLGDWLDKRPVRAVTPHGTYTFGITSVILDPDGDLSSDAPIILRLEEVKPKPTKVELLADLTKITQQLAEYL